MLLMVFPSSSVLTAPQASVASPKADKHALNHMVEERHCQKRWKRNWGKRAQNWVVAQGNAGSGRSLGGYVVGW